MSKQKTRSALDSAFSADAILITGSYSEPEGAIFDDHFQGLTLKDFSLQGGSFSCSTFTRCRFENATFVGTCFDHVLFEHCVFVNTTLKACSVDAMRLVHVQADGMAIHQEGQPH